VRNLDFAIPIIAITVCAMALVRLGVHRRLVAPLAFVAGQGVSYAAFVVIALFSGGGVGSVLLDVSLDLVVIPVLVLMLVRRPSRPWLYALIAYEILATILNVVALTGMSGSVVVTMLIHIAIRVTAAVTAAMALKHFDEIRPGDASMAAGTTPKV
jgi:hypothetical protein